MCLRTFRQSWCAKASVKGTTLCPPLGKKSTKQFGPVSFNFLHIHNFNLCSTKIMESFVTRWWKQESAFTNGKKYQNVLSHSSTSTVQPWYCGLAAKPANCEFFGGGVTLIRKSSISHIVFYHKAYGILEAQTDWTFWLQHTFPRNMDGKTRWTCWRPKDYWTRGEKKSLVDTLEFVWLSGVGTQRKCSMALSS